MGQSLDSRIIVLGLENSGKTSFIHRIKFHQVPHTTPTEGYDIYDVTIKKIKYNVWDVTGKARSLWSNYYKAGGVDAIIWIVDSADQDSLKESKSVLEVQMREPSLQGVMLFVLATKQDLEGALDVERISKKLKLANYTGKRLWECRGISATTGDGVHEAMTVLTRHMKAHLLGQAPPPGTKAKMVESANTCCACMGCGKRVEYIKE